MKRGSYPEIVAAMRADGLEAPQESGLWYIERRDPCAGLPPELAAAWRHQLQYTLYPDLPTQSTALFRRTDETMHPGYGECVMSDDPQELRRHLPIILAASGRVLVTGLGLGCVVRGLLTRPAVTHIDVVEVDPAVLAMVAGTFEGNPRVTIHVGDGLTIAWPRDMRWDYAWHDVWGENPHTQALHMQLLIRYRDRVGRQGAWQFPRIFRNLSRKSQPGLKRRGASTGLLWGTK